jgi:hypothetical protein
MELPPKGRSQIKYGFVQLAMSPDGSSVASVSADETKL